LKKHQVLQWQILPMLIFLRRISGVARYNSIFFSCVVSGYNLFQSRFLLISKNQALLPPPLKNNAAPLLYPTSDKNPAPLF
jgi:hypothetical protein